MAMNIGNLAGPNADHEVIQELIAMSLQNTIYFVIFMQIWASVDSMFYDITELELEQPKQLKKPKGLRINDLSDIQAHKMTHFYVGQLQRLYTCFDLEGYLWHIEEEKVQ